MDPADTNDAADSLAARLANLTQEVRRQGGLGVEHSRNLREASASLARFATALSSLESRLALLTPPSGPSADPPATVPIVRREPYVPTPAPYGGDPGACHGFLLQVGGVFQQQPLTYATETSRIAYLVACLRGVALTWASAEMDRGGPEASNYLAFTTALRRTFDHPVRGREAAQRLLDLRQGSRSVAELVIDFRIYAAESGWRDDALRDVFQCSLADHLRDEIALRDEPSDLEALITLAMQLDNRIRERRRESVVRTPSSFPSQHTTVRPPPRITEAFREPPSLPEPEPMQLGRVHLTMEERDQRRRTGACMYCGRTGHILLHCPRRPGNGPARS